MAKAEATLGRQSRCLGVRLKFQTRTSITSNMNSGAAISRGLAGTRVRGTAKGVVTERAVVVRVSVAVAGFVPSRTTCGGVIAQVAALGAPLQLKVTGPLKLATGAKETLKLADWPAVMVALEGAAATPKSGVVPPPGGIVCRALSRLSRPWPKLGSSGSALPIAVAASG
jgi:hypothetical protein